MLTNPEIRKLRNRAEKLGFKLKKSRLRLLKINGLGLMLINAVTGACALGSQYDASYEDVVKLLARA